MKTLVWTTMLVGLVVLAACSSPTAKAASAAADAWGELQVSLNRTIKNNSSALKGDPREWRAMVTLCVQAKVAVFQAGGCTPADCANNYNTVRNRAGRVRETYNRLSQINTPEMMEPHRKLMEKAEALTEEFLKTEPAAK